MISNKDGLTQEDRVKKLEETIIELKGLYKGLGGQVSELKEKCHSLEVEITILKQGGNL